MDGFSFSTDVQVRFAETDAQGIAHHAAFLVWFEVARVAWLDLHAGGYKAIQARGIEALTTEVAVRYHRAAHFHDRLTVWARCTGCPWRAVSLRLPDRALGRADRGRAHGPRGRGLRLAAGRSASPSGSPRLSLLREQRLGMTATAWGFGFFVPTRRTRSPSRSSSARWCRRGASRRRRRPSASTLVARRGAPCLLDFLLALLQRRVLDLFDRHRTGDDERHRHVLDIPILRGAVERHGQRARCRRTCAAGAILRVVLELEVDARVVDGRVAPLGIMGDVKRVVRALDDRQTREEGGVERRRRAWQTPPPIPFLSSPLMITGASSKPLAGVRAPVVSLNEKTGPARSACVDSSATSATLCSRPGVPP